MKADEIRPIVAQAFDKSLATLNNPNLGIKNTYSSDCTDVGGAPTGAIDLGWAYNAKGVPRENGVEDLLALEAAWAKAGYHQVYPAKWNSDYIVLLFQDASTGIGLRAHLTPIGEFHIGIHSPCVEPSESALPASSSPRPPSPSAKDIPASAAAVPGYAPALRS
ncbi:hypothetical protein [Yinghuangia sp. YIM S10712]|uniref:hypothetical protein n=1 Tax=Yinghuangia sp. YIM S10712 TaxID=3436930 RepID=UPI003F52FF74